MKCERENVETRRSSRVSMYTRKVVVREEKKKQKNVIRLEETSLKTP